MSNRDVVPGSLPVLAPTIQISAAFVDQVGEAVREMTIFGIFPLYDVTQTQALKKWAETVESLKPSASGDYLYTLTLVF